MRFGCAPLISASDIWGRQDGWPQSETSSGKLPSASPRCCDTVSGALVTQHRANLAAMHSLVRFSNIAAGGKFTTTDL